MYLKAVQWIFTQSMCMCVCVCACNIFFVAEKMIFQLGMAELVKVDNIDFASEEEFVHVDYFLQSRLDDW